MTGRHAWIESQRPHWTGHERETGAAGDDRGDRERDGEPAAFSEPRRERDPERAAGHGAERQRAHSERA
jgi:hypothetical protein